MLLVTFGTGHPNVVTIIKNNELWKLTRNTNGSFEWNRVLEKHKKKTPSPRIGHSGWEYDGKLWIFGCLGPTNAPQYYLTEHGDFSGSFNNQFLHFNPVSSECTNLKCFGIVPSPRSYHATTVFRDTVWLYGGQTQGITCDGLYQLDMCFLTWTQIQTMPPKPGRMQGSLNVTRENQLVLHCGKDESTWILDLSSYSWKACRYEFFRCHHTGSLGINNNIIVISGTYP